MKLMVAIIQDRDSDRALKALTAQGVRVTRIATSGGFLEQGNSTLLIGVEEAKVATVIEALRSACHRRNIFVPMASGITDPAYGMHNQIEVEVGGATIFTFEVEHFEQI
jgi:uncharacterized protein YaaQ